MSRVIGANCPIFDASMTVETSEVNKLANIDIGADARMLQVASATVAYNDAAKDLLTLPAGAKIAAIYIDVTTAFNATSPTYKIGYATDDDALASISSGLNSVGRVTASPPPATIAEWNLTTGGAIIGTAGGTGGSAGAGVVKIVYWM